MSRPLNPFAPSHPISPGQFVGRHTEIKELEAALLHAKKGKPRHFLMTGGRGVGKTSFLDYIRRRAADKDDGDGFNFLIVDFAINKRTTRLDFARALQTELERALSAHSPVKEVLFKAWSFIKNIEAAGISYKGDGERPENQRDMYLAVADSLGEIVRKVCEKAEGDFFSTQNYDGLLILIDEVDQANPELDIGSFLKYMLERLNRNNCRRVIIGLAGLNSSISVLVDSHPSSLRIFDELPLGNLSQEDVNELLSEAELEVRNDGYDNFSFSQTAKDTIFEYSDGHPHFVHLFGYAAFENFCNSDNFGEMLLSDRHVTNGAFESRGAIDLIGDVYFRRTYNGLSRNNKLLSILDCLSEASGHGCAIDDIRGQTKIDILSIEKSLQDLAENNLVVGPDDFKCFRIRHSCFAYWLKMQRPSV